MIAKPALVKPGAPWKTLKKVGNQETLLDVPMILEVVSGGESSYASNTGEGP